MNLWAAPGKQCVCINDSWNFELSEMAGILPFPPSRVPMLNEVLTIRDVFTPETVSWAELAPGGAIMSFQELGHDCCFAIAHFRPLITEEDDVEMFRSITVWAPYSEVYDG